MNWKFWESPNKEPKFYIDTNEVPTSTLLRWFLYDSGSKDPNKRAKALGFTPISEEGEEMEKRESRERLEKLNPYIGFISMISDISGQVTAEMFAENAFKLGLNAPDDLDEDEVKEHLSDLFTSFAVTCLVPAFSAAIQLGILVNPGTVFTEANE